MIPYVELPRLSLFGITLHPFGILLATAIYLGYFLARRRARVTGLDPQLVSRGMVWIVVGAFVGGHLVEVLLYNPESALESPLVLLAVWTGLSSFGGFLGAAVALVVFCRGRGESALEHSDAIVYGLVPAWILGRLGCTIVHDHPGLRSDFLLAVAYPGGARHDLGFYELLLTVGLTLVLLAIRHRRPFPGFATAVVLGLYAPFRFAFELLRVGDRTYLGLTPAQFFSAGALVLSGVLLARGLARRRDTRALSAVDARSCEQHSPAG